MCYTPFMKKHRTKGGFTPKGNAMYVTYQIWLIPDENKYFVEKKCILQLKFAYAIMPLGKK